MLFDQQEFDIRCEWGEQGVAALAPISNAVIIVDVLSFSTSVAIAVDRGAVVFPCQSNDDRAAAFAAAVNAQLVGPRRSKSEYSVSPESMLCIPAGARIVMPSLNGATLTLAARPGPVLAGCLRNAKAVALAAQKFGPKIAVIPAGERWQGNLSLRPSFEDLLGAGAIINYLSGRLSPEAAAALAVFHEVLTKLDEVLSHCSSGKELIVRGFAEDVNLASQLNASHSAPLLVNDAYIRS